MVALKL